MTHEDSDAGGADTARAGGRKALHETAPRQHARALPDAALWRVCAAEAAGAALLVLLTCLPGCASTAPPPLYRALASGLVVAVLVQSLDHISGAQMNPTVTLAAILWRRIPRRRGLAMMAAQLAGATLGGAALHWVLPARGPALCVTLPAADLGLCKAVAVEAVLGGCLALVNCASWDARNAGLRDSWPLRIGLSVAALSLVGGELTGASMNPVRSFAPALWSGEWTHHWTAGGTRWLSCLQEHGTRSGRSNGTCRRANRLTGRADGRPVSRDVLMGDPSPGTCRWATRLT